ncbi:MAG: ATP-dependent protease ATPase subunit HslU [Candidatus Woesearchaeota archaeon]
MGRDVESMIRDLVSASVRLVKDEKMAKVKQKARKNAMDKVFNIIYPLKKEEGTPAQEQRKQIREKLENHEYDDEMIEVEILDSGNKVNSLDEIFSGGNINSIVTNMMPNKKKKKKLTVKNAIKTLTDEESDKLIDFDTVNDEGIKRAEQQGIIFIDEIDKIAVKNARGGGNTDVSREGVQRDILPFVEGCTVSTKYGTVKTDHMLFIAAGAFHMSRIEDLIPEFQGRFPIRVDLDNLTKDHFIKILTEPKNAIILQYKQLLKVDNIDLKFTDGAIAQIAEIAEKENETSENIGARRLHTIIEELLEEESFKTGYKDKKLKVNIDEEYIQKTLKSTIKKHDLKKYVL